jgi:hypothetical protein
MERVLSKLLIALASGLLTIGAVLAGVSQWTGIPVLALLQHSGQRGPDFGFQAYYVTYNPDPEPSYCNFGYGSQLALWWEGPHDGFEHQSASELARESLAWFEDSSGADQWLDSEDARLELVYPSGDRDVTVKHARDSELSWEGQLGAWFERFPPTSGRGAPPWVEESYSWDLEFGELGEVCGSSLSAEAAIATMERIVVGEELSSFFGAPNFDLGQMVEVKPHNMHCYSVDTDDLDELDTLPRLLGEQREANQGRFQ